MTHTHTHTIRIYSHQPSLTSSSTALSPRMSPSASSSSSRSCPPSEANGLCSRRKARTHSTHGRGGGLRRIYTRYGALTSSLKLGGSSYPSGVIPFWRRDLRLGTSSNFFLRSRLRASRARFSWSLSSLTFFSMACFFWWSPKLSMSCKNYTIFEF